MPKRSDREVFEGAFDENPFENFSLEEIYNEINWGNKPKNIIDIESPEPLVALGFLAKIVYKDNTFEDFKEGEVHLAIGAYSNYIYLFPKDSIQLPEFSEFDDDWQEIELVTETHYYSDKGGDESYYFHEHEKPYPALWRNNIFGIFILIPQTISKNQRSYAVLKEGIVG